MSFSSIQDALDQYNAALPWQGDLNAASNALDAVRYLLLNRLQRTSDQGAMFDYESLEKEKAALEKFVGVSSPRAFGRSRRVPVSFHGGGIG